MNRQSFSFFFLLALFELGCDDKKPSSPQAPAQAPQGASAAKTLQKQDAQARAWSPEPCKKICDHSATLGCSATGERCLALCALMAPDGLCSQEMRSALACLAEQPLQAWHCGAQGFPEANQGACDAQQQAAVSCLSR